jgi:hypothetical protein
LFPFIPYCAIVALANIVVLGVLIGIFVKMYAKTRAQVHIGLTFFISMLFLDNIINIYTYLILFDLYGATLLPFVLMVRIVQLVGSLIFLKITLQ